VGFPAMEVSPYASYMCVYFFCILICVSYVTLPRHIVCGFCCGYLFLFMWLCLFGLTL
jgi:hypothetical protein